MTPSDSKGLEFDSVVVVDPQQILDDDNGERLLYIALTRTTSRLDVLCPSGTVPGIISGAFTNIKIIDNAESLVEMPDSAENVENVSDAVDENASQPEPFTSPISAPKAGPSPASMPKSRKLIPNLKEFDESNRVLTNDFSAELDPLEQELVRRNALHLSEIVLKIYGPRVQVAILAEALKMLTSP